MARPKPSLTSAEDQRREQAYKRSHSDREGARLARTTQEAWRYWRRRRKLPAKGGNAVRLDPKELQARNRAYRATNSDKEAARRLKISRSTFRDWRTRANLPAQGAQNGVDDATRTRIWRTTSNDRAAAKNAGIGRDAWRAWRRKRGLAAKGLRRPMKKGNTSPARRCKAPKRLKR